MMPEFHGHEPARQDWKRQGLAREIEWEQVDTAPLRERLSANAVQVPRTAEVSGQGARPCPAARTGCVTACPPVGSGRFRRPGMITILFNLIGYVVWIYMWAVILAALFSMLAAFGVLDTRNRLVWSIGDFLYRVTDPVLAPIRNVLPNLGGIDISPWIVVLLIQIVILPLLGRLEAAILFGTWRALAL